MNFSKTFPLFGREKDKLLAGLKNKIWKWALVYVMATLAVALGFGLRLGLSAWVGPGLPTYVTFYPAVMVVALLAGFGPGLFATALTVLATAYWVLPQEGFAVGQPVDFLGQVLFSGMGLFLCTVAELYRRKTADLIEQRRQQALREAEEHHKRAEVVKREKQRFHDVLDMLPAYVVLLSPDYHVPFANRFFEERFGKSKGQRCFEYLFQRTDPCENCESYKVLKTKAPHHWEWVGPDGRLYDIHDFAFTDTDSGTLILEMGIDITEIKQAQAALKETLETLEQRVSERTAALLETQQRLQAIMQAVPIGISFSDDVTCRQIKGNPAWLAQFEFQPTDNVSASALDAAASGRQVRYYQNGGQLTDAELPLQRAVTENRLIPPMEIEVQMPSGRRWVTEASGAPILNGKGQVIGGLAVTVDITQRKEAEAKIAHQNRVLEAINRIFREALTRESEGQIGSLCLAVAEEVTGSKFGFIDEINTQTGLLDVIAISDPGWKVCKMADRSGHGQKVPTSVEIHGIFGRVLREGKGFFTNDPASHPDTIGTLQGHPPLTAFLGVPLMQEGKTIGLVAVANREGGYRDQDLAALKALAEPIVQVLMRRRAEQALRQAKDDWEQTFNTVPDLVAIMDNRHRLVRANRAMVERLGAAPEQCLGQACYAVIHGTAQPPENCPHTQTCRDGREHSAEVFEERLGGHFLVTTTPLFDDRGQVTGSVHVARDITPFKKAEDFLRTRLRLSELAQTGRKEELVRNALDEAERHTGSTIGYFHFVKEDQETLLLNTWSTNTLEHMCRAEGQGKHYPISQAGVWVDCLHARAPVIHNDYASLSHKKGLPEGHAFIVRHLGVPVFRGDRVVAIMGVGNKPADYTQDDVNVLQELASLTIDLVAFKDAEEAQRASEARFRLLSNTAGRLLATEGPLGLVKELCQDVMTYLDCQVFFNYVADPVARQLRLNVCAGIPEEEARRIEWLDFGVAVCGCVARDGQRIIAEDIQNTADLRTELIKSFGIQAYGCHPLVGQGRVIGTLSFGTRNRPHFTAEEVELMRILADQVALAMQRLRAQEDLRRSEEHYRLLIEQAVDGIFVSDPQGRYLDVNSAGAAMLGYTPEEIFRLTIADVITEEEVPLLGSEMAKLAGGKVTRSEWGFRRKNGSYFPGEVMARQLPDGRLQAILRDISERKKTEDELRASLKEKEVLLKEIHHRVKNNMQVISSLVSLQADGIQDPVLRGDLQDVRDRVRSMALVHEKLYQSENLAQVEFAEYARSLLNYLWRSYGRLSAQVRLNMDLQPLRLSIEKAVPCGLILNELAGNALKHAFPKKDTETQRNRHKEPTEASRDLQRPEEGKYEVQVNLSALTDGKVMLRISDNGKGLPPGLDWRQGGSLGLRLVQMLTSQLAGSVEVRTQEGSGTEFEVTF